MPLVSVVVVLAAGAVASSDEPDADVAAGRGGPLDAVGAPTPSPAVDTSVSATIPPTTTAVAAQPSTTTKPPVTSTSTSTSTTLVGSCGADDFRVEVSTDKAEYRAGEPVRYASVVRNISMRSCRRPTVTAWCVDDAAQAVGECRMVDSSNAAGADGDALAPGGEVRDEGTWDQTVCGQDAETGCGRVAAGTYTITTAWGFAGRGSSRPFVLFSS